MGSRTQKLREEFSAFRAAITLALEEQGGPSSARLEDLGAQISDTVKNTPPALASISQDEVQQTANHIVNRLAWMPSEAVQGRSVEIAELAEAVFSHTAVEVRDRFVDGLDLLTEREVDRELDTFQVIADVGERMCALYEMAGELQISGLHLRCSRGSDGELIEYHLGHADGDRLSRERAEAAMNFLLEVKTQNGRRPGARLRKGSRGAGTVIPLR